MKDTLKATVERVVAAVDTHVRTAKGFEEESMVNPFVPVDCVSAFAVARKLVHNQAFDYCISVAPEGHVYGYFFECLGIPVLSVHVDYPPRRCQVLDDLTELRGKRVLILEDDVASGTTLSKVIEALLPFEPTSMALFLGRAKKDQALENIPAEISSVYLAEDELEIAERSNYERQFTHFFGKLLE